MLKINLSIYLDGSSRSLVACIGLHPLSLASPRLASSLPCLFVFSARVLTASSLPPSPPRPGFVPLFALPSKMRGSEREHGRASERRLMIERGQREREAAGGKDDILGVSKRHRNAALPVLQLHSLYCGLYCPHSHFPHRTHSAACMHGVTWSQPRQRFM